MTLVLTPLLNIYSSIPGYTLKTTSIAKIMKSAGSGANREKKVCCKHQWQVTIHNCKSGEVEVVRKEHGLIRVSRSVSTILCTIVSDLTGI